MANIEIILTDGFAISNSMQIGDILYFTSVTNSNHPNPFKISQGNTYKIGPIKDFGYLSEVGANGTTYSNTRILAETNEDHPVPTDQDFFFFVKNNEVETAELKGYYAELKFANHSTEPAELFSVGASIVESSK